MTLKVGYVFVWVGKPPKCKTIQNKIIVDQNIFQDELVDPSYGHLWDLKNDKCLVHQNCDCKLIVMMVMQINLVSDVRYTRSYFKQIKEAYDKRGLV